MVQETLRYNNRAKWYVFMEADTYFSWPTLMQWLAHFDPSKPHYIGTETQIADVIFAHGGSGFIVSNPAMQRVSDDYADRTVELNEYTDAHWAGDCVLGKVLADVGVPLHFSWPILQNSNVGELDEFTRSFYRQPWCFPAVAFHHLAPRDIEYLWNFERRRWREVRSPFPSRYRKANSPLEGEIRSPAQRRLQRAHLSGALQRPRRLGQPRRRGASRGLLVP